MNSGDAGLDRRPSAGIVEVDEAFIGNDRT